MAGAVDREHAPSLGERRDRHPLERAISTAVDEQQRRPGSEFEHLGFALRLLLRHRWRPAGLPRRRTMSDWRR
jgi:hypothetical protein